MVSPFFHRRDLSLIVLRFGRDNFQEAAKISNRADAATINWANLKYMVFDIPVNMGSYKQRYEHLGTCALACPHS